MSYVTGSVIKELREKKRLTQKELAERLCISEKTVSKWETGKGLPDIGILEELSRCLGISIAELLTGELSFNENRPANMKKLCFYMCPVCGNVIQSVGQGDYSCCGIRLPVLEAEKSGPEHEILMDTADQEYYVKMEHPMTKQHYLSFFAYVTSDRVELVKLYPEQNPEVRFCKRGHGILYACCNRHGLICREI